MVYNKKGKYVCLILASVNDFIITVTVLFSVNNSITRSPVYWYYMIQTTFVTLCSISVKRIAEVDRFNNFSGIMLNSVKVNQNVLIMFLSYSSLNK